MTLAPSAVTEFRGKYRFLSNFYTAEVAIGKIVYPTVEHAYQAEKTLNEAQRVHIACAETPGEAKKRGRRVTLRPGWDDYKIPLMRILLACKFTDHRDLRAALKATGNAELIEGNTWGDTFWGVCRGTGQNWLGRLLMEVRTTL